MSKRKRFEDLAATPPEDEHGLLPQVIVHPSLTILSSTPCRKNITDKGLMLTRFQTIR